MTEETYITNPDPSDLVFPRVMWVWDGDVNDAKQATVLQHDDHIFPWCTDLLRTYRYASDTHPVTGRPATAPTDPLDQIREVMKSKAGSYEKILLIGDILAR